MSMLDYKLFYCCTLLSACSFYVVDYFFVVDFLLFELLNGLVNTFKIGFILKLLIPYSQLN